VEIIELLPLYALYAFSAVIAVVAGLIALSFWRNISPAAPGVILGYYEVLGRYAGGSLMKRIQGTLVDASHIFLNPGVERKFKERVLAYMESLSTKGNPENPLISPSELKNLKKSLKDYSLSDACRIIVTRDRFFTKHVLIQYGYVEKPITEYAMHEERGKFTFSSGLISRGVITGTIKSFPDPWEIPKIGKCRIHLFKPDVPPEEKEKASNPPEWLAKIALYTPSVAETAELLESKDEQIRDLHRQLAEMVKLVAASATSKDAYLKILACFSTEGDLEKRPEVKKALGKRLGLGIWDVATVAAPTLIGSYAAAYAGYEWTWGALIGLAIGIYLNWRRSR